MKKFLRNTLLFSLPILIVGCTYMALVEHYARTKTSFAMKKRFLESNLDSIEIMVLGSSHTQNAINPSFFRAKKASNMAFGGQPNSINYFILDKYIDGMKNLKVVVLEIASHSFFYDLRPEEWNGHIYSNVYNIDYKVEKYSLKNYSLFYSCPEFFSNLFKDELDPRSYKLKYNEDGFTVNDFNDRFLSLKYDSLEITKTAVNPFKYDGAKLKKLNEEFVEKTIERCQKKGVTVILYSPPFYPSLGNKLPKDVLEYSDSFANVLCNKYNLKYYDFLFDKRFKVTDFKNDNHLNPTGAEKMTKIMDSLITNEVK